MGAHLADDPDDEVTVVDAKRTILTTYGSATGALPSSWREPPCRVTPRWAGSLRRHVELLQDVLSSFEKRLEQAEQERLGSLRGEIEGDLQQFQKDVNAFVAEQKNQLTRRVQRMEEETTLDVQRLGDQLRRESGWLRGELAELRSAPRRPPPSPTPAPAPAPAVVQQPTLVDRAVAAAAAEVRAQGLQLREQSARVDILSRQVKELQRVVAGLLVPAAPAPPAGDPVDLDEWLKEENDEGAPAAGEGEGAP